MINHFAYFDCLAICSRVEKSLDGVASTEVHLFAYLSCLLSLYKKQPVSAWGYTFTVTEHAYPFSPQMSNAIDTLVSIGYLKIDEQYLNTSQLGLEEYQNLRNMTQFVEREPYIDGACSSLLALPVGSIRNAILQEVDIKRAVRLSYSLPLLSESGLEVLHEQFAVLSSAIKVEVEDLMVPAIVWLTYLSEVQKYEIDR